MLQHVLKVVGELLSGPKDSSGQEVFSPSDCSEFSESDLVQPATELLEPADHVFSFDEFFGQDDQQESKL